MERSGWIVSLYQRIASVQPILSLSVPMYIWNKGFADMHSSFYIL